jgi:predicted transcriptional regulator
MGEAEGYILRIASEEWVRQVFDMAIYYTSLSRKWKEGQTILFVSKTSVGDMVIGYGVIQGVISTDELSEEERRKCEEHGWKRAIEFTYVKRFEKPLPLKKTFLKDSKFRGRYLHGLVISKEQLDSIISQAEIHCL